LKSAYASQLKIAKNTINTLFYISLSFKGIKWYGTYKHFWVLLVVRTGWGRPRRLRDK